MRTLLITDSDKGATDRNFEYLLGFQPSFGAMIIGNNGMKVYLDSRYFNKTLYINKKHIRDIVGIDDFVVEYVQITVNFIDILCADLSDKTKVGMSDNISLKYYSAIKNHEKMRGINLLPISDILEQKRIIKSELEIDKISKAIDIIDCVYLEIEKLNSVGGIIGKTENDIARFICLKILEFGGDGVSFEPIVAFGENSAIAHHMPSSEVIGEGVLLIDMGAKYSGYCSDFTRTFWVYNTAEKSISDDKLDLYNKFREIYQIVQEAHINAYKNTEAGMNESEIDELCREYIEKKGYGDYFIHSTGHGIGLDVHETPHITKNKDGVIEDGTVFTIEPGIYLPGEFGIRIEDIVFLTNGSLIKKTKVGI